MWLVVACLHFVPDNLIAPPPSPPTHTQNATQAWLTGGRWVPLLPPEHPGLSEVKWCMNRFRPYLVIDPVADVDPGSRDLEEVSMEVRRVVLVFVI